jgi:2-iminobutanoate/2-iminopropanoate deaminase
VRTFSTRFIRTGVDPIRARGWGSRKCKASKEHVPIRPDGSIEQGDATQQTEVTFADLQVTLKAAGADLKDVALVQIYLTSLKHKPAVDEVYKRFFSREPYPVRACIAVSELPTPETMIEIVVTATLPH